MYTRNSIKLLISKLVLQLISTSTVIVASFFGAPSCNCNKTSESEDHAEAMSEDEDSEPLSKPGRYEPSPPTTSPEEASPQAALDERQGNFFSKP